MGSRQGQKQENPAGAFIQPLAAQSTPGAPQVWARQRLGASKGVYAGLRGRPTAAALCKAGRSSANRAQPLAWPPGCAGEDEGRGPQRAPGPGRSEQQAPCPGRPPPPCPGGSLRPWLSDCRPREADGRKHVAMGRSA